MDHSRVVICYHSNPHPHTDTHTHRSGGTNDLDVKGNFTCNLWDEQCAVNAHPAMHVYCSIDTERT